MRIPINIKSIKIKNNLDSYQLHYEFEIDGLEKSKWNTTYIANFDELKKFRDEIDSILSQASTAEILNLTEEQGNIVEKSYKNDSLCKNCTYKLSNKCKSCLFTLQSPLERKFYLFCSEKWWFKKYCILQYAIDWHGCHIDVTGKTYNNPNNNFKNVLTIVDFYIEKGNNKLCIYTDGHTYHERTEEQAQHDKMIDRKLQELGYIVLRYTGKDIEENMPKIINEIEHFLSI
ncbi:MAG: DUF559 domain-containing protein [Bacteroidales bacterium]|nr:DUF559 domain-containing protein [Bacteroidales bacterium]